MAMKKREIDTMLSEPHIAVIAVTAADGAPHAVPTWYEYKKGEIVFHTDTTAYKFKCLEHDPRVTLVIDTKKAPYKCVILKGRANIEIKNDDKRLVRMAIHYLGEKNGTRYAKSMSGREVAVVSFKPDHVVSWDYSREMP